MLDNGQKYDWFQSSFILASGLIAGISFLAFVAWELTDKNPIVNLRIFHDRTFAVAVLVLFLALGGFAAMLIIIPLWLQTNLGYTATSAGEIIALTAVLGMVSAPIVGKLMGKVDPRALICVGVLIMSAACLYRIGFNQDMTFAQLIPAQLAFGLSLPFWFLPIMSLTVSTVKPEETAAAAGLSNFMRTLATAVSVAIATTYWLNDATRSQASLVGELHRPQALIDAFERAGRTHPQALQALDNLVQSQAVMLSTNHWCLVVGVTLAITACLIWLMPKSAAALQGTIPSH
jgi:DHA2 family multidrug resistance protein